MNKKDMTKKKSKGKRILRSDRKLNTLPNDLDNKACDRLISAILTQAWKEARDNNFNGDIPYFLESELCNFLCFHANIDTEKYKGVVYKRFENAYKAKKRREAKKIDKPTGKE